jgi:hypothetical protein
VKVKHRRWSVTVGVPQKTFALSCGIFSCAFQKMFCGCFVGAFVTDSSIAEDTTKSTDETFLPYSAFQTQPIFFLFLRIPDASW